MISGQSEQEQQAGAAESGLVRHVARRDLAIIILFVMALALPFLDMPVHMDDGTHLDFAAGQVDEPLKQHIDDYYYFGRHFDKFRDTHPRGHSLYLSLLVRAAGGESEPPLHAGFLIFPLMAGISMYFLARRFRAPPLLSALMLTVSPAYLVFSHSLMTDPPAMALWLLSVTAYVYGVDRRNRKLLTLATVALTIGIFFSYQVLSVIPLLAAYAVMKRRLSIASAVPFVVPALVFAGSVVETRIDYAAWPMFSYRRGLDRSLGALVARTRGVALVLGGVVTLPPIVWLACLRKRRDFIGFGALMALVTSFTLGLYLTGNLTANQALVGTIFSVTSGTIVWLFVKGAWREARSGHALASDSAFLTLWFSGVLFYNLFFLPYPSARYLLPLLPPAILMIARGLNDIGVGVRRGWFGAAVIAVTLLLSIPIAIADYDYAGTNRLIASEVRERYADEGVTVWFVGDLGFRHYMEREGFQMLPADDGSPRQGDIIVESNLAGPWPIDLDIRQRISYLDTITYYGRLPVSTKNYSDQAAFYGNLGVMLPYVFSYDFNGQYYIFEVTG